MKIERSRLDTAASARFDTDSSSDDQHVYHPQFPDENMKKEPTRLRGTAAEDTGANLVGVSERAAVAVFDGNLVVSDTVFVRDGDDDVGAGGRAVVFKESDGQEGEHMLVVRRGFLLTTNCCIVIAAVSSVRTIQVV